MLLINKKRKEFSTGLFINLDYWNSKKQKALENNSFINSQISLINQKISKALMLKIQEIEFGTEDIYLAYKGKNTNKKNKTFLEVLIGKMKCTFLR